MAVNFTEAISFKTYRFYLLCTSSHDPVIRLSSLRSFTYLFDQPGCLKVSRYSSQSPSSSYLHSSSRHHLQQLMPGWALRQASSRFSPSLHCASRFPLITSVCVVSSTCDDKLMIIAFALTNNVRLIVGFRGSGREFVVCSKPIMPFLRPSSTHTTSSTLVFTVIHVNRQPLYGSSTSPLASSLPSPQAPPLYAIRPRRTIWRREARIGDVLNCTPFKRLRLSSLSFVSLLIPLLSQPNSFAHHHVVLLYTLTLPAHALTKWSASAMINSIMPTSHRPPPPASAQRSQASTEDDPEKGKQSDNETEVGGGSLSQGKMDADLAYEYEGRPRQARSVSAEQQRSESTGGP